MESGRAACRPIEGTEIPTDKDFRFKYLELAIYLFSQFQMDIVTS